MMDEFADALRFLHICDKIQHESVLVHLESYSCKDVQHKKLTPVCTYWVWGVDSFAGVYKWGMLRDVYRFFRNTDMIIIENKKKNTKRYHPRERYKRYAINTLEKKRIYYASLLNEHFPEGVTDIIIDMLLKDVMKDAITKAETWQVA